MSGHAWLKAAGSARLAAAAAGALALGPVGGAARAETSTVLLCYSTNVLHLAVEDGAWSSRGDFAHKSNGYGGASYNFAALASDGRRVFVGESGGAGSRILEFDLAGNYLRRLALVGTNIEHMCVSQSGRWVYATVGISLNSPTNSAVVHRYDAVSGAGGVFVPNAGTNALGEALWTLQGLRGVAADGQGRLWVSNRNSGQVFLFSEADGSYLGLVGGLAGVQGLHYSAQDGRVYGSSSSAATYAVDVATLQASAYSISGLNNRLGITQVQGALCSGRWDTRDVSTYDLGSLTREVALEVPAQSRQILALPRAPLRGSSGFQLLLSETGSNRVARLAVDSGYALDAAGVFAGGAGARYAGLPLRQPRGLAAWSDAVYVAEGVTGGRVLRFTKWGSFKAVALDFAATPYADCVPAALALSSDGQSLYVTDAHTLFVAGGNVAWANVPTNGFYDVAGYGSRVFKWDLAASALSVFADSSSVVAGNMLLDPRGVAVDGEGSVYCTSWFNRTNALYSAAGSVYKFSAAGARLATFTTANPGLCFFDPSGSYTPAAGGIASAEPGVLTTGNGINDLFWTSAAGDMSVRPKLCDLGAWTSYLDAEVLAGRTWFTDPEYGTLWRRAGDAAREAALTGLAAPTYLAAVAVSGPEPPPTGTAVLLR